MPKYYGIEYDEIPDFKSIEVVEVNGNVFGLQGKEVDHDILDLYFNSPVIGAGSQCFMYDTGEVYIYSKVFKKWNLLD